MICVIYEASSSFNIPYSTNKLRYTAFLSSHVLLAFIDKKIVCTVRISTTVITFKYVGRNDQLQRKTNVIL